MGVGPMNLVITNDALYQLSYTSLLTRNRRYYNLSLFELQELFFIFLQKFPINSFCPYRSAARGWKWHIPSRTRWSR